MSNLFGWECPRCFKIHSPFSVTCDCPPRTFTSSGSSSLPITFHPATTGFGNHTPADEIGLKQLKTISEKNKKILTEWCNGMRQMDIANNNNLSNTRIREIIKKYRRLLPEDKRL